MSRKFFVKDTDYATEDTAGVVKLGSGLSVDDNGKLNVTGGSPYIYMNYDDYGLLTSIEADKLYWLTDSRGKHAVYMNGYR